MRPAADRPFARSARSGLLLAIDTAGARCSAAVVDRGSGALLAAEMPLVGRGHAEHLMGVAQAALVAAGAGYRDLAALAVCVGPGSFTGIRVGVAAVRGLALSLRIPAIGVTSLEALAEPFRAAPAVLAVHDARRGEVFAALFAAGREVAAPRALSPVELDRVRASGLEAGELLLVGSGAEIAARHLPASGVRVADASGLVDIEALARIAARREPGAPPSPLYLRGADAKPQPRAALFAGGEGTATPIGGTG